MLARLLGRAATFAREIATENTRTEPRRDPQGRKLCLRITAGCERPNLRRKFRLAGHDHEAHRAIDSARLVPPLHEGEDFGLSQAPKPRRRTINHLSREHWIDGQRKRTARRRTSAPPSSRDTRPPRRRRILPTLGWSRIARTQSHACACVALGARAHQFGDFVARVPFLKLLVLKRDTATRAHQGMMARQRFQNGDRLQRAVNLACSTQPGGRFRDNPAGIGLGHCCRASRVQIDSPARSKSPRGTQAALDCRASA